MPSLSAPIDSPWDGLFAISIIGILAGGLFAFLTPAPAPNPMGNARRDLDKAKLASTQIKREADEAERDVLRRTWALPPDALGTRVMDDVGEIAERRHLQLANFQAGRTVDGAGLRQLAFAVTFEGEFPDVVSAMEDLERPEARLALKNVTLSPLSAEGGRVTATIGLTAFVLREDQ